MSFHITEKFFRNNSKFLAQPDHNLEYQLGLLLSPYARVSGDVISVLAADGQDCYFGARLIFPKSIVQRFVEVPRYTTWFSSNQVRYCLRATLGLLDTDDKNVQNVSIIGRAMDETYEILHSGQLGKSKNCLF